MALADKLDTLVGFWAIDEKPTGSKDPYALRRAALGVIRIVLENELRLPLATVASRQLRRFDTADHRAQRGRWPATRRDGRRSRCRSRDVDDARPPFGDRNLDPRAIDLMAFFADRLKVYLRDKGARHDLIDAVFALPGQDDLLMIVRRVEALGRFLDTDDGKNLLAGYRRAANILKAEEKKHGEAFAGAYDPRCWRRPRRRRSPRRWRRAARDAAAHVAREDFEAAMRALSALRAPVDAFFTAVTVNADDRRAAPQPPAPARRACATRCIRSRISRASGGSDESRASVVAGLVPIGANLRV